MKDIAALLWDVDGVFVDTERLHFAAWKKLFENFGETLTLEEYLPCIGRGSRENTTYLCGLKNITDDYEALNPRRREFYEAMRKREIPVLLENIALLKAFAARYPRLRMAAVSSAARRDIAGNLGSAGIADKFEKIISFEDDPAIRRKPEPDIYLFAAKQMGVAPQECLAFEDSSNGVESARAAGILCVALPNEFTNGQDFSKANLIIRAGEEKDPERIFPALDSGVCVLPI